MENRLLEKFVNGLRSCVGNFQHVSTFSTPREMANTLHIFSLTISHISRLVLMCGGGNSTEKQKDIGFINRDIVSRVYFCFTCFFH